MPYLNLFRQNVPPSKTLKRMGHGPKSVLGPEIRVLVWNIFKARRKGWAGDFGQLLENKDLVLLQESILDPALATFFKASEHFEWVMARTYKSRNATRSTGIKTGCCVPSQEQYFYHSPDPEPVIGTHKMLLATRYPLNTGETLLVLNVHAINFTGAEKYARQMDQIVAAILGHTGPVILGGDFNTWSPGRKGHFLSMADRAGLVETSLTRRGRPQHIGQLLDHVFSRGLKVRHAESLENIGSSDHHPLTVIFEVLP